MREEHEEFTLYIVAGKETHAAYCFSAGDENDLKPQFWIAKSVIKSITRFKEEPGKWRMCRITIPSWLAEKHDRDL